jgi:hypothetical protein
MTSAGQILPGRAPPYFILIDRALRDDGTSYHYLPPGVGNRQKLRLAVFEPLSRRSSLTLRAIRLRQEL